MIIIVLIPVRHYWFPKIFTPEELAILDAPTANSDAVLVSLGGPLLPERGSHERQDVIRDIRHRAGLDPETGLVRRRTVHLQENDEAAVIQGDSNNRLQHVTSIRR